MPKLNKLNIWFNGEQVGTWHRLRSSWLQYNEAWVNHPAGRPLSLSLPFTVNNVPLTGKKVFNYFDNLLPDNEVIRRRIKTRFGLSSTNAFDLLSAIGRDCAGAVQLLPENEQPVGFDRIRAEPLTESPGLTHESPGVWRGKFRPSRRGGACP
jgi:serine/threonine-protein kinase HipA